MRLLAQRRRGLRGRDFTAEQRREVRRELADRHATEQAIGRQLDVQLRLQLRLELDRGERVHAEVAQRSLRIRRLGVVQHRSERLAEIGFERRGQIATPRAGASCATRPRPPAARGAGSVDRTPSTAPHRRSPHRRARAHRRRASARVDRWRDRRSGSRLLGRRAGRSPWRLRVRPSRFPRSPSTRCSSPAGRSHGDAPRARRDTRLPPRRRLDPACPGTSRPTSTARRSRAAATP